MSTSSLDAEPFEMTSKDRELFGEQGYLLRERVFEVEECASMGNACNALILELEEKITSPRVRFESVDCSFSEALDTTLKWEREFPEVVSGVEAFAHLSVALGNWANDLRLTGPCREVCGSAEVTLFTEKLNLKRAKSGGSVALHRDGPHWEALAPHVEKIVTAMIYLDDTTRENGCLEVFPGSHRFDRSEQRASRAKSKAPGEDLDGIDLTGGVLLEAPAGSVIWFGANLVHRSSANRSNHDRRALLLSYQPAGCVHQRLLLSEARTRFARNTEFLRAARERRAKALQGNS